MFSFQEFLKNRRSVRNFKEASVPRDIIETVIKESTYAPSSGNEQSWQFSVLTDKQLMAGISRDCKQTLLDRIAADPEDYAKKYKALLSKPDYNIFYNAPALVFILGRTDLKNSEINCTLAASYLMFSAVNRGLGSCWISFGKFVRDEELKEKIGLDSSLFIAAPIILGYPVKIPSPPPRKTAEILWVD